MVQKGLTIWFTGLSGSGKSTLALKLKEVLEQKDYSTVTLDGDVLRTGLNRDLGFSEADRKENLRRAGEISKLLTKDGLIVLAAFITPLETVRHQLRSLFDKDEYLEIFVDCPLQECEARDPKGLYSRARKGEIPEFTGITSPFERPFSSDLVVNTSRCNVDESLQVIVQFLEQHLNYIAEPIPVRKRKPQKRKKIAVLGLDCVPSQLLFDDFLPHLPNFRMLVDHGVHGTLRSTEPPITIPSWTTITTGKDPGELGLYGFRNRKGPDYDLSIADSTWVQHLRVWDYIEATGGQSLLIGIPQTYPAKPHNGITIADFLAPKLDNHFTYPSSVVKELNKEKSGEYLSDVKDFRNQSKGELLSKIYSMVDRRFQVARDYLLRQNWDFFMMVEIAPDRIHHAFWRYFRTDHRLYEAGNQYEHVIPEFYKYLDAKLGSFLALLDDDTTLVVLSDHGAKTMMGGICINEWLQNEGYLHLKKNPSSPVQLSPDLIDWSKTRAWGEGGYYGRIFLNVKGRDANGIVDPLEYDALVSQISNKIEYVSNGDGTRIRNHSIQPRSIYRSLHGFPPDLIVYFDELNYRSIGTVGNGKIYLQGNDTGPDDANHDYDGIFIGVRMNELRSGVKNGTRIMGMNCLDITPTILNEFGIAVPQDLGGKIFDLGSHTWVQMDDIEFKTEFQELENLTSYTKDEEEIVKKRLADLGYI